MNSNQPSQAPPSPLSPSPAQDKPRTYDATVDALTAAIQCGNGIRTAVLAREAVYMKTQQLCKTGMPKNKTKGNKKKKKGKDTPAPLSKRQHRELAIKTVRKVIYHAIEHENAYNLARDIMNDAVRKNVKSIDFDHVARENAMKKRVRDLVEEKTRTIDELRARLIELGDGVIPPREKFFIKDGMTEHHIEALKNREIRELKTHLRHFEGSLKAKKEEWLAYRVGSRPVQDKAMNDLAASMDLLASSCSGSKDSNDDGGDDSDMELDFGDEVM
ncbi:hypothetical protein DBV05_g7530 [Lasiodiplodia theobromae]|uniref:Uncharacterized protein n=1 Tax=Lasiodiplodia theobromae TaxID=45133 RepID=A0A5N5D8G2_9PEZI|nr:hypothetical protein DBV05_g7530 [Lasiodiplodia theobromae]